MSPPPKRTRSRNGEKVHRSRKKPVINSSERASSGEHDLSNEKLRARIDELSKTRDELEYNRNRYLNFFQYAPFAYAILDHDGLIRDFNLQAHTMLGPIQRGSLTGVPFSNFVVPRHRQLFLDHLFSMRRGEAWLTSELCLVKRAGDEIPVELSSQLCMNLSKEGLAPHFLTAVRDLSERHLEEGRRKRAEVQLHQAEVRRRAAQEAEKAKDIFLASLSHELRTPLTPVLAVLNELEDRPNLPEEVRGLMALMRRNVDSEVRLIDDLLDVTRIMHQKLSLDMNTVDALGVVKELVRTLTPEVHGRGLGFELKVRASRHTIRADTLRLRQILANLVRNAVQFTDPGGHVTVETSSDEELLAITVRDDGIGMEPATIARLFQPFEQASQNRRGRLGLGLMIVKGLVEAQGGTIRVESAGPGRGSTFSIRFPLVEEAVNDVVPEHVKPPPVDGVRVLLVEDHEDTAESLARLLHHRGYVVTIAKTLGQALEKCAEPFDVLLSDLSLPDGSGHELMRRLSSSRPDPPPAIALSGRGSENDVQASLQAGFRSHLVKPVHFHNLVEEIERVRAVSTAG